MIRLPLLCALSLCATTLLNAQEPAPAIDPTAIEAPLPGAFYDSVVRIEVNTQVPDYKTPWQAGRFGGGIGTGFLIGENRFLTNAHVVSDARRILVTRRNSSRKHAARVVHIAHDCDLALLELEDFQPFSDLPYLTIGELPKLESTVRALGYPTGGSRLSVTRGVVSRIDFLPYSHSLLDSHLVVQIDAAINPGNSGGPILQNGKVVGVAFQGRTDADNTGYMIPVPVIRRFLKDIEDGTYDRYVDLGVREFPLFNQTMRQHLGLADNGLGVLVSDVLKDSPADGVVQKDDILLNIDGSSIDSSGRVQIGGESVNMNELVERKFAGDTITLQVLRDGKPQELSVTLRPYEHSSLYRIRYDLKPRYIVHGGMLFQPLNRNVYGAHKFDNDEMRYLYANYVSEAIFEKREDIVVLSDILTDDLTADISGYSGMVLDSVNGTEITSLAHLHKVLGEETDAEFLEFRFAGASRPIVLPVAEIPAANTRISELYAIPSSANLEE